MSLWSNLTTEQTAIMIVAFEEGYVVNILDEYRARSLWERTKDTRTPSDLDEHAKVLMMVEFASVVSGLVDAGYLEVYEQLPGGAEEQLLGPAFDEALRDPASWIASVDGGHRVLELRTGSAWNDHEALLEK